MKLISLNTWGGRASLKSLLDFFINHRDVDILCLQEIWNGGEKQLKEMFPEENIQTVFTRYPKSSCFVWRF